MKMTRRFFLQTTGSLAAYCGISPLEAFAQSTSEALVNASSVTKGRTIVVIFLRGGMDGLNLIVPYGERAYYDLRRGIGIPRPSMNNGALDLDGFFGLHPAAKQLLPFFQSGEAVALHAVGYDKNTRSHFEEQDVWETGVVGNTVSSDGWLNRHLLSSKGHGTIRAISIGDNLPRILRGSAAAYAIRGVSDLSMPASYAKPEAISAALEHAYCTKPEAHQAAARDLLSQTAATTMEGIEQLKRVSQQKYVPATEYPKSHLAEQLREAARLIKADVGLEVVEIDYGGWDTHNNQGGAQGQFEGLVRGLSEALAAFRGDLGDRMNDVLVLTLSDFGRTAAENGTGGTDHGWANCMFALGGPVLAAGNGKARNVLGAWPGLTDEKLHEKRDLLHTTDFRDVLGEVVSKHLGNANLQSVLPSHEFKPVGLV